MAIVHEDATAEEGLPTVSGQKPTLSLCGIDLSQAAKADAPAWPAIFVRPEGRASRLPVIGSGCASFRGARFPHYQKCARVKPPITSIIRTAAIERMDRTPLCGILSLAAAQL